MTEILAEKLIKIAQKYLTQQTDYNKQETNDVPGYSIWRRTFT